MNNSQFRKLFSHDGDTSSNIQKQQSPKADPQQTSQKRGLGLLAPRAVRASSDNKYVLKKYDHNPRPTKKFKSSAIRGSQLPDGYIDRTKARYEALEADKKDEKAERIKELEEKVKLGEISRAKFETLREEITSGDISNTHLVKGLDRKLLERVRRGEDVMSTEAALEQQHDVEDELDKLEQKDVETVVREKSEKRGNLEPTARKRTRDEIMAELKAQRKAEAEARIANEPALDNRWRGIKEQPKSRTEIDKKGREVLVLLNPDGTVRKKVRKAVTKQPADANNMRESELAQESIRQPVVEQASAPNHDASIQDVEDNGNDDDDDIFEGVGTEYDPLGEDNSDEDSVAGDREKVAPATESSAQPKLDTRRNYFNDKDPQPEPTEADRLADMAAIVRKAALIADKKESTMEVDEEEAARQAKYAKMLNNRDRDLEDMDLGFGASRNDDGDEADESTKLRLSEWKNGQEADEDEDKSHKHGGKDKKKPRKRKGDAKSMTDIMKVIEGRQKKS